MRKKILYKKVAWEEGEYVRNISYLILKFAGTHLAPLAKVFCIGGIYGGVIINILFLIQLLCFARPEGISAIQAGEETSDWILSKEISPPPVEYDAHYLCTVSLQGHRGLVKPIRYGIRRGSRIVVNRQLCVANAFEQLLEERIPRFHKAVRHFYDTYGYPISKWITNPWSADVVYLLMKPLEWIFVMFLYLFDEKPENRIASQYLPKGWDRVRSINGTM